MTVVLDASSAISQTLNPLDPISKSEYLIIQESDNIICPDILISETISTFWKYCLFEKMTIKDAEKYTEYVFSLIDQFIGSEILWKDALEISVTKSHSAYDCFYLALAINKNAILLTRDKKLQQLAIENNIKTE